ncbi:MAG TPA: serine hydrolase [Terriglobia bacterium]|nr:serine hydrolase [Terriglobia bacterium]
MFQKNLLAGYGMASLELGVPLSSQSVYYMGSVSKQFTAASVVLAAEQGYLALDDNVRKYIPELPDYGHQVTLREMLHHIRELLALPTQHTPLDSRILSSSAWRQKIAIDEFTFESEPLVRVAGWFLRPATGGGPLPTIVYVSEGNRNQVVQEGSQISEFTRKGLAVCAIDLRGSGLSIPHYPAAGPIYYHDSSLHDRYVWAFFTLGKPVLGQRVWDFLRCLDYLQSRRDVDQSRIRGLGERGAALAVLLAGVLDDRLQSLLLDRPLASYQSVVESEGYSLDLSWFLYSVLNHFDIPDLIGSLAPRPCWILNAADSGGETLIESEILARYARAIEVFKKPDTDRQLRFIVCPEDEKAKIYSDWLQTT